MRENKSCVYYTTSALRNELCYSLNMSENTELKPFKKCFGQMIGGSLVVRGAAFATLATMFILGIITIPIMVAGIAAVIFGIKDYYNNIDSMKSSQRTIMSIGIIWVVISLLALVVAVIMLQSNTFCLLSCKDDEYMIRNAVLFVLLFL